MREHIYYKFPARTFAVLEIRIFMKKVYGLEQDEGGKNCNESAVFYSRSHGSPRSLFTRAVLSYITRLTSVDCLIVWE